MGPNYSYLLHFKHECLWDVLHGSADVPDSQGHTQATSRFPDRDQILSLMTSFGSKNEIQHDTPEFSLATSLSVDEDSAILEYLPNRGDNDWDRSPPGGGAENRIPIGFMYLAVYAELSQHWALNIPTLSSSSLAQLAYV